MAKYKEGICPSCGNKDLFSNPFKPQSTGKGFCSVKCDKCGFIGRQWYTLTFEYFTDKKGKKIKEDKNLVEEWCKAHGLIYFY